MASATQILANQANAQYSTGPRTHQGKARVSQNARRHGFTAQTLHVAEEDKPAFDSLRAGLLKDARPEGAIENEIFSRLLTHAWNLRRIESFESRVLDETDPISDQDSSFTKLERCARYRRDVERSFYRALNEIRKLQTQRAALLQQEPQVIEALYSTAPLAEITRLTKQTDSFIQPAALYKGNLSNQSYAASRKEGAAHGAEIREAIDLLNDLHTRLAEKPKAA